MGRVPGKWHYGVLVVLMGAWGGVGACASEVEAPAGITWQRARFDSVCVRSETVELPVDVGNVHAREHGGFFGIDLRTGKLRLLNEAGQTVVEAGGLGDGPGEFRLPRDIVSLNDSLLAIIDPALMRVTVLDSVGKYVRSFQTSGFAGARMVILPGNGVMIAGLNVVDGDMRLLAQFDSQGTRVRTSVSAPELLRSIEPLIDAAVLVRMRDSTVVVANIVVPTLFVVTGSDVRQVALHLPDEDWVQLQPFTTPPTTPGEMRARLNGISVLTGAGRVDDSTIVVGWRTSQDDSAPMYMAVLNLDGHGGSILSAAPGAIIDVQEAGVWIKTAESEKATVLARYECRLETLGKRK